MKKTVGERLRDLRHKYNMKQIEVCKEIGVTQSMVYRWENDIVNAISMPNLKALAKLYHTSVEFILTGVNPTELPIEVDNWLHEPRNREKVMEFYRKSVIEEERSRLNKLK